MIKLQDAELGLCWRDIVSKTVFYNDWHEEFLLECKHIKRTRPCTNTPFIKQTVCDICQQEFEFNKKQIPLIPPETNISNSGESVKSSEA